MLLYIFPSGPLHTNAVLFGKDGVGAAIDPSPHSTDKIMHQALRDGLTIEKILLTHSHWDHIADVHPLQEKTGAEVYIHSLDASNLESPGSDGLPLFIPIVGVRPDHLIQDGDSIQVGKLRLAVIHTPGHSPGSVCFYIADQNVLFAGDTLFQHGMGRVDLPTGDPERMWSSLQKLATLPSCTKVIPGHGPNTEIGKEF